MTEKKQYSIKSILLKILVELCRIILGFTFIFSGFVKAIDPVGGAYKIEDYLTSFGLQFFLSTSIWLSALLAFVEFILGCFMLLGIYKRRTTIFLLIIMCIMTPITLYLAITNPVSDCGCFGDALIISNWDTFFKNIILLFCAIICVKYHKLLVSVFTQKFHWIVYYFVILYGIFLLVFNFIYEPMVDFRPYRIGTDIEEGMYVHPEKREKIETKLVYAKDGVETEYEIEEAPWDDPDMEYVGRITKVIKKGEEPKIKDFKINLLEFNTTHSEILGEEDITDEVLSDSNYVFLIVSPFLEKINTSYLSTLEDIDYYSKENKYECYFMTASSNDEILRFMDKNLVFFDFCHVDDRVLKTISRTNPSVLLLKDGVILNKWADLEIPDEAKLNAPLPKLEIGKQIDINSKEERQLIYIGLLFFVPLCIFKILDFLIYNKKDKLQNIKK